MEDNPFSRIIESIRKDSKELFPTTYRLATVISKDPLKIDVARTIQEGRDLLKNSMLGPLEPGDQVLVIPIDDEQRYIILCKVVEV